MLCQSKSRTLVKNNKQRRGCRSMGQTFTLKSGDLKFTAVEQGEGPLVLCLLGSLTATTRFVISCLSWRLTAIARSQSAFEATSPALNPQTATTHSSRLPTTSLPLSISWARTRHTSLAMIGSRDYLHGGCRSTRAFPQPYDNGRASFWPLCERGVL